MNIIPKRLRRPVRHATASGDRCWVSCTEPAVYGGVCAAYVRQVRDDATAQAQPGYRARTVTP
jgi:hypothetical protein